jgi:5-(hydroxymethyl)furfural/furfural oxidase
MGMIALRGTPDDYADWEEAGAEGWGWADVLPWFCRLEKDLDFRGDMHGDAGPVTIRRTGRSEWPPLSRAVENFAHARGLPFVADLNSDFRDGYCSVPMSNTPQSRASSAICYLGPEVRRRGNLTIATSATVTRILLEGRRAVGVRVTVDGREEEFRGGEICLSSGALFSPALLMRAGIGPARHLQDLGIPVVADLAGVGANLQNHAVLFIGVHLARGARQGEALRTAPTVSFRYSSGIPGCPPHDLYVNILSKTSWSALGAQLGSIVPTLLRPASRGRVSVASRDPLAQPLVEFNFLGEKVDLERLMQVFTFTVELACSAQVRALSNRAFPVRFNDRIRTLNERNTGNALKSSVIALALDAVPGIADLVFSTLTGRRVDLKALATDREQLAQHIRENVSGVFHPAGTCRMGGAQDRAAVTDSEGRVHGMAGLRVVDASIMPNVIAGNTNIPTIMIAEKIAAGM